MKRILYLVFICLFICGCDYRKYTVTFDTNGGNYLDSIEVAMGDTVDSSLVPVKEGYLFVNWIKDGVEYDINSKVYGDIELTANWIKTPDLVNDYLVTYVADDYEEKIMVKEGDVLSNLEAPVKDGYIFLGWYLDDDVYDFNSKVTSDIKLVAKYKKDVVVVTFDNYDGTVFVKKEIDRGSLVGVVDIPKRDGYRFLKWVYLDQEFSFDMKIYEDITLRAIWEKIEYVRVSFDTDGGELIDDLIIEKYSRVDNLPIALKSGYKFLYWKVDGKKFEDEVFLKDIKLTAVYEVI